MMQRVLCGPRLERSTARSLRPSRLSSIKLIRKRRPRSCGAWCLASQKSSRCSSQSFPPLRPRSAALLSVTRCPHHFFCANNPMDFRYFDAHSHIQDKAFDADRDSIIARMKELGVGAIVAGCDTVMNNGAVELAEQHDFLWATVGLHPVEGSVEA